MVSPAYLSATAGHRKTFAISAFVFHPERETRGGRNQNLKLKLRPQPKYTQPPILMNDKLTQLVDSYGIRGRAQPSLAQRLNVDDVIVVVLGEGQLGCRVGCCECVYLFVSLPPV